jgi:uncharacterized membrane protein
MEVNHMNSIHTIIRRRSLVAFFGIMALALLPTTIFAHGGEEHVIGTVTSISDTSVTVKTTAGKTVAVGFDAKTTFARVKQVIQKSDIKVGDRIVIHAVEANEKLVARTVEIGSTTTAKH